MKKTDTNAEKLYNAMFLDDDDIDVDALPTVILLTTKVSKKEGKPNSKGFIIPPHTMGELQDVIIKNGKAIFSLAFVEYDTFAWYELSELEDT